MVEVESPTPSGDTLERFDAYAEDLVRRLVLQLGGDDREDFLRSLLFMTAQRFESTSGTGAVTKFMQWWIDTAGDIASARPQARQKEIPVAEGRDSVRYRPWVRTLLDDLTAAVPNEDEERRLYEAFIIEATWGVNRVAEEWGAAEEFLGGMADVVREDRGESARVAREERQGQADAQAAANRAPEVPAGQ